MPRKATFYWSQRKQATLHFIQPGGPSQNAFVESLNGRFHDSCLNQLGIGDINDSRATVYNWRNHYNETPPRS